MDKSTISGSFKKNDDFFKATIDDSKPNGLNDTTEGIYHNGVIHYGKTTFNTSRSNHIGVATFEGNGTFQYQTIVTKIPTNSLIMPTLFFKGYGYGTSDIIDFKVGFYTYNSPANTILNQSASSIGTVSPFRVKLGNLNGFVAIEIDWGTPRYFYRYNIDIFCAGNSSLQKDIWFEGWSVSTNQFDATYLNVVTVNFKSFTNKISLTSNLSITGIVMQPISLLTMTFDIGWYMVEFYPLYDVSSTTVGTGWNFQGGTAVLANYSFRSILPSTNTANYINNYSLRNQNFTTAQTERITNNRATIIAEFQVTTAGTVIPHFRAELLTGNVTLKVGTFIKVEKI